MRRQSLPTAQMGALPSALVRVSALTWQHVTFANYQDRSHQCSLSLRHYLYVVLTLALLLGDAGSQEGL